jgi:hypothetical protein
MLFPSTTVVTLTLRRKRNVSIRPVQLILPAGIVDSALALLDLRV